MFLPLRERAGRTGEPVTAYTVDPTREQRHKQAVAFPEYAAWLTALELEGLRDRTRLDYSRTGAAFLIAYDKTPGEWTHYDLNAFLASVSVGQRRKVRAHLASFFRWLEDEDLIDRNPMRKVRTPRQHAQQVPDIFTDAEVAAMCADPLLALMLHTGIRKGECRRLQRRHINLDSGELRVIDGKGGKSRVVPLNRTALKAVADIDLTERLNPEDHLWFSRPGGGSVIERSRPVGEATFANWWRHALERVGVDYRKPHMARHTFSTRYLRSGGKVKTLQLILGHASSATTVDLYAHLDVSDARADILLLDLTPEIV